MCDALDPSILSEISEGGKSTRTKLDLSSLDDYKRGVALINFAKQSDSKIKIIHEICFPDACKLFLRATTENMRYLRDFLYLAVDREKSGLMTPTSICAHKIGDLTPKK